MRARSLLPSLLAFALAGCGGDRSDTIRILGIERGETAPAPAASGRSGEDSVALAIRITPRGIPAIADRTRRIMLTAFPCGRGPGQAFSAGFYDVALPPDRDWRRDGPVPATIALTALAPRHEIDDQGYDCAQLVERGLSVMRLETWTALSNIAPIPRAPASASH